MTNYIYKFMFLMTLMSGTIISISSSSWLGMWVGLEINLLSFIPLMIDKKNLFSNESAIKYFLIQAFASLIFLFISIMYIMKFNIYFNIFILKYHNLIINSAMLLKLGAAPFHFWFPNIIEGMSWSNALILLTWQKFAPLMIISYSLAPDMIYLFIIFSTLIGSISGLNQTTLRKILAYSSINHIGWLLTAILFSNVLWMFYFSMYFLINLSIIMIFKIYNLFNINQIFMFNNNFSLLKFCLLINFLSLGGLPPFLGFLPKWMIIENLIYSNNLFILFFIVMMALITLFFYIRLTFSAFTFSYPSLSWDSSEQNNSKLMNYNMFFNLLMILMLLTFFMTNYYLI